jgi:hypothetical protein
VHEPERLFSGTGDKCTLSDYRWRWDVNRDNSRIRLDSCSTGNNVRRTANTILRKEVILEEEAYSTRKGLLKVSFNKIDRGSYKKR